MDDRLRELGRDARREIERAVDVDTAWSDVRDRLGPVRGEMSRTTASSASRSGGDGSGRRVGFGLLAAAALVALLVAGTVWLRSDDSIQTAEPPEPSGPAAVPATAPEVPAADDPLAPTDAQPEPEPEPTVAPPAGTPDGVAVVALSSADPPPDLALEVFTEVELEVEFGVGGIPPVAIGELGVVVNQTPAGFVTVIGFDGEQRTVSVEPGEFPDAALGEIAYGPGDVLYGTRPVDDPYDFVVDAIPLSGDRAGETVARSERIGFFLVEAPRSVLGHTAEGVIARTSGASGTLLGHVGDTGEPTTIVGEVPRAVSVSDDLLVSVPFGPTWQLTIDGSTEHGVPYTGPPVPAPTTGSRFVYATHLEPGGAEVDPTGPVIAVLGPGGEGQWWSVPDGWTYAASDLWGTVFARLDGTTLQLALLDGPPPSWADLRWEGSRIERNCLDAGACTQVRVGHDGTTVSYDPTTRTLTRHTHPPAGVVLADDLGDVWLAQIGPDGLAYLYVDPVVPDVDGNAADLVAYSLHDGTVGEVARWSEVVDWVGDSELVATPEGLVNVNCCGPDTVRPDPGATPRVGWIDRNGDPIGSTLPAISAETDYPMVTITRDDRAWIIDPGDGWLPRGMPTVVPTFDGGIIAWFQDDGAGHVIARGWPDGVVETVRMKEWFATLEPSGVVVVPNGDRFARVQPFEHRGDDWPGRSEIVPDDPDGALVFPGLDEYLSDARPDWAFDPVALADAIAGPQEVNESRVIDAVPLDDGDWFVTLTATNFFDDSVFGARTELRLSPDPDDGAYRVSDGRLLTICQPGRGHQDFTPVTTLCT